jgi:subtilisin family serine protease
MNLPAFLGTIVGAIHSVKNTIAAMQSGGGQSPAAWVICNAWGVFNPTRESPTVPYSDNQDHPLAIAYRELAALGADIVFAAGNCGEFCPNHRCSPVHIGPGHSIHGVNALAEVLTVGAVRSDGLWLGYSGQGPGITNMAHDKPDLCAPSQFDDDDGFGPNTGTSAACGLAAGAVALLRTRASTTMTPLTLRTILCETAEQPYGPKVWQERTGHGVINPVKAAAALP